MKRKIDIIALSILIAAAVNCGLIGVFRFNVMTWLFEGQSVAASRIIYMLVAVAGLWCINLIAVQGHKKHSKKNATPDPLYNRNATPDPVYNRNGRPDPVHNRNGRPDPMHNGNTTPDPVYNRNATPNPVHNRNTTPDPVLQSDPISLKDNPEGETVCSPYFSQGCINEDTELPTTIEGENENEKH